MESGKYQELTAKLRKVEALYRQPGTAGEKQAAALAIQRLRYRLDSLKKYEQFTIRKPVLPVFDAV